MMFAFVTIYNFQKYRYISHPGWTLSWSWAKKEVIWYMFGAQATEQGNCLSYTSATGIPHSCKKTPTVVDLLPDVPYNQQVANCCKGGVMSVRGLDPENYISSFQITVGNTGTTNYTIKVPRNFTFLDPHNPGHTCGPAIVGKQTKFITSDGRRVTQAFMTWNVTCTYSQFLVGKPPPACCTSPVRYINETFVPCYSCTCGCKNNISHPESCVKNSSYLNGDNCVMPPSMPPSYAPYQNPLNASSRLSFAFLSLLTMSLSVFFVFV
ncbi:hypothetical protein Hanom_Chr07g00651131 [Helianthus anomalus]